MIKMCAVCSIWRDGKYENAHGLHNLCTRPAIWTTQDMLEHTITFSYIQRKERESIVIFKKSDIEPKS